MLAEALEAEVEAYVEAARGERDERGRALVVRKRPRQRAREILLGGGSVAVKAPRVNDTRGSASAASARTDVTKGPGSRAAGLAMIFKLMEAAEGRWRRLNAPHLVALVRAGAEFVNGELAERVEERDAA